MTERPRRKPGRPRSTAVDQALDVAVMEVLAEQGYDGMRIDDVAARAGVSKTTIYRRSPTKASLVVGVLQRMKQAQIPMPETGGIEGDLRAIVYDLYDSLNGTPLGAAMVGLLAEKDRNPELAEGIEALWAARQRLVAAVIRRGADSGELRSAISEAAVLDLLAGPAYYRLLITGQPLDRASAERHADVLVLAVLA